MMKTENNQSKLRKIEIREEEKERDKWDQKCRELEHDTRQWEECV